jgi:dihydroorotase
MVARDIAILELTGGHYHVLHVSTKESLEAIRLGKQKGLHVTCEAAPHHFLLNDETVLTHNTYAKMNPPLRSEEDRLSLIEALRDGTIDAIATDHAPHDEDSKKLPLEQATFGIVGVETMLPLSLELYHNKILSLRDVLAKMTCNAAKIINSNAGRIKKNAPADLVLIDIDHEWVIDIKNFSSKSQNSPFNGRKVKGRALRTIVGGKTVYSYTKS